jgi:hypothetical protein
MLEYKKYTYRENKVFDQEGIFSSNSMIFQPRPPQMLPYPHHFVTPNNIDIDLRLHNRDLQTKIKSIISSLLTENTPKNWFHTTKRRLINQYKRMLYFRIFFLCKNGFFVISDEQVQLGLSKEEIAKRVQTQLNIEYAERAFETIENSDKLEQLSPGLGRLLVSQARSILTMKSVVQNLSEDLDKHLKTVFIHFILF